MRTPASWRWPYGRTDGSAETLDRCREGVGIVEHDVVARPGHGHHAHPRRLQGLPAREFTAQLALQVDALDRQLFEDAAHHGLRAAPQADGRAVQGARV